MLNDDLFSRRMTNQTLAAAAAIDQKLSKRYIELDPGGYFIIYLDQATARICAKHYRNVINDRGLACDPETGEPIPTRGKVERTPTQVYSGRTAKELCVQLFEQTKPCPVTMLDHAAYLGREFQRAESALLNGQEYVQD
jgi:dihydropteroate synthase